VRAWHVGIDAATSADAVALQLDGSDVVLSQFAGQDCPSVLQDAALRARGLKVAVLPLFVFPGFHPDMIYLLAGPGRVLHNHGSDYHSRLVAAGFRLGLTQAQVARLFNSYVFASLGYFEVFDAACSIVIGDYARFGYDVTPLIPRWLTAGAFMHTLNHPKIRVLQDLCLLALRQAGVVGADTAIDMDLPDSLAESFVGAISPPIARRLGIAATGFALPSNGALGHTQRDVSMQAYISESFRIYAALPPAFDWGPDVTRACEILTSLGVRPGKPETLSIDAMIREAQKAVERRDWSAAARHWGDVATLRPESIEAHFEWGRALREVRDWEACDLVCSNAWLKFPDDLWIARNWALVPQYAGDFHEAIRRYRAVCALHDYDALLADLADCLLMVGEATEAAVIVASAMTRFPHSQWLPLTRDRIVAEQEAGALTSG
jgi:hypothetical protein